MVFLIYGRQPFLHQTKTICLASPRPQSPLGSRKGWVALWKWGPVSGWAPGVAESQALGRRKSSGGGGKTGWTSPAFLGWLQQPAALDLGQGNEPRGRPQGLPYTEEGHWGSGIRLEQRPHSVLGRARASPREMGGSRYSKPHWNKRQADSGLGRGAGRRRATAGPLLVLQGSSQHPVYGSCHPRRSANPGPGSTMRVSSHPASSSHRKSHSPPGWAMAE